MLGVIFILLLQFLNVRKVNFSYHVNLPQVKQDSFNELCLKQSMLKEDLKDDVKDKYNHLIKNVSFMLLIYHTCVLLCAVHFIKLIIKNISINNNIVINQMHHVIFHKLFYIFFQNKIMLELNKRIMMIHYQNNKNIVNTCDVFVSDIKNNNELVI